MRLANRVAVVTGAQQGIGKAIALAYAGEGADVVVNYFDDRASGEAVAAEIQGMGRSAIAVPADVASAEDVQHLIAAADEFGGVDLLVNNAGIFPRVAFLEMQTSDWDQVLNINLKGGFLCAQAAARRMVAKGLGGGIINLASQAAYSGPALGTHYAASKAGLIGFTRAAALALAPHGIRVNAIAPGLTDTAQPRDGMTEEEIRDTAAALPLGRICEPEDIADMAVFLASDQARHITGQTLHVNGGSMLF